MTKYIVIYYKGNSLNIEGNIPSLGVAQEFVAKNGGYIVRTVETVEVENA